AGGHGPGRGWCGPACRWTGSTSSATRSPGCSPASSRPSVSKEAAMTDHLGSPKLRPWHTDRQAVVYVRQSTPQQVTEHPESTARQYALADRAVALGW